MNTPYVHPEEVWQEFAQFGTKSLDYKRKAALLIPILARSRVYLRHGFATLTEAASVTAGINGDTVNRILTVHKRTVKRFKLRAQIAKVGYNKVYMVLSLLDVVPEKELVRMVSELTKEAIAQRVKDIKREFQISAKLDETGSGSCRFSSRISDSLQQELNKIKYNLEKEVGNPLRNEDVLKYLVSLAKEKEKSKEVLPEKYERASKNITLTLKHKEHEKAKNNGICTYPGCNEVATEIHHTQYQALRSGRHTNLRALCKTHHQIAHFERRNKSKEQIKVDKKVQKFWRKE